MPRARKDREAYLAYQREYNANRPESHRIAVRKWYAANKEHAKRASYIRSLRTKYGLSLLQKEQMLAAQGNKCGNPGCGRTEPGGKGTWLVDHCHATNKVRGLLCHGCNVALGQVDDNVERVTGLALYLNGQVTSARDAIGNV